MYACLAGQHTEGNYKQERTNNMGSLEFPRRSGHSINCIGATNTDCKHSKAASVWRMRVYKLKVQ
jgi:hypothetical protein